MSKYCLELTFYSGCNATVELPDGHTWDEIQDWYIKWNTLHFKLKGVEAWGEIELQLTDADVVDYKRPESVSVFPVDEEDNVDYDNEVAERS
jgi:hypothetical protein